LLFLLSFFGWADPGLAEKLQELHEGNDQDEGRYEPEVKTSVLAIPLAHRPATASREMPWSYGTYREDAKNFLIMVRFLRQQLD
jgi:hypothetical protein